MSEPLVARPTRRHAPAVYERRRALGESTGSERRAAARPSEAGERQPSERRTAIAGLLLATVLALAMLVGSTPPILLASALVLTVALVSPMTGLIVLLFLAPFPRPLIIPTPGLYVFLLGAILLGYVLRLPLERPQLRAPRSAFAIISAYFVYVAAQFGASLIDGPRAERASAIASSFSQLMASVMTFIAAALLLRGRSPFAALAALLVSAALAATMAIAQSLGLEDVFGGLMGRSELVNRTAVDRVTGPFLDPNYFGAFLATATTLAVACAVIVRSVRVRVVLIGLSAYIGLAMVLTLSRGALAALVAGLAALAFTRSVRTGLLTLAAMALLALLAWPFFAEARFAANPDVASGGLSGQLESSGRTVAWLSGLQSFAEAPIFGVGWGRLVEEGESGIAAHNWYVSVLAETGLTGFVLWVLFIAATAYGLRTRPRAARTVAYSVMATWMAASLFIEVPRIFGATTVAFVAIAAALVADWTLGQRTPPATTSDRIARRRSPSMRARSYDTA